MAEDTTNSERAHGAEAAEEPSLLEQMGGLTGLVAATLPVVVLVPVNSIWGLGPALMAALGVAVAIMAWRIVRKETLQPAVSGLLGVALCAAIAWFTGDAKGYFLYGIWMSFILGVLSLISIVTRWPAVGVVWKGINGETMVWRQVARARRAYAWATAGWATVFLARFFIQNALYNNGDSTAALGIARIIMGWPLTGVVTLLTIWMVRRANAAVQEAADAGLIELADAAAPSAHTVPDAPGTGADTDQSSSDTSGATVPSQQKDNTSEF